MAVVVQLCRTANRNISINKFRVVCTPVASCIQPRSITTSSITQSSAGKHWRTERVVAVGLLGLIPAGIMYPNPVMDYALAALIPLHNHWGFNSIIVDYVPQSLQVVAKFLLYAISIATFGGLTYLTYSDIGIGRSVRLLWTV